MRTGRDIAQAVMLMIPEAWQNDKLMSQVGTGRVHTFWENVSTRSARRESAVGSEAGYIALKSRLRMRERRGIWHLHAVVDTGRGSNFHRCDET